MSSHVIGNFVCCTPCSVKSGIVEEISWSNKTSIAELESKSNDSGWTIKSCAFCIFDRDWHEWSIMRPSHPTCNKVWKSKRFKYFSHRRQTMLRPDKGDRVVLSH